MDNLISCKLFCGISLSVCYEKKNMDVIGVFYSSTYPNLFLDMVVHYHYHSSNISTLYKIFHIYLDLFIEIFYSNDLHSCL
ncbi:hypothetical protein HanIR_Chr10g0463271 [Helianthus annuus]|nr:hypothetical protein HanIR_Chr10g0463271 [Helianthus annuus]